jgi:pimeloyl-ACP methyl ester carboxylesterase
MPYFDRGNTKIYYEDSGEDLPVVLLLAPGGMKSSIAYWEQTPWDPRVALAGKFRVIAMDQRNAGKSSALVGDKDGWHNYTGDQIALINYLSIERFHVVGMCIGGPFCLGLAATSPARIISATIFQTIGLDNNRDIFFQMFDTWAAGLKPAMPDVPEQDWDTFRTNMYGSDAVLFNVDEAFLKSCTTPLMVFKGDDDYHPASASELIRDICPSVEYVENWKSGADREAAIAAHIKFLQSTSEAACSE